MKYLIVIVSLLTASMTVTDAFAENGHWGANRTQTFGGQQLRALAREQRALAYAARLANPDPYNAVMTAQNVTIYNAVTPTWEYSEQNQSYTQTNVHENERRSRNSYSASDFGNDVWQETFADEYGATAAWTKGAYNSFETGWNEEFIGGANDVWYDQAQGDKWIRPLKRWLFN